jgi:hypothetical protein
MAATRRVLLAYFRDLLTWKSGGKSNQRRPQASMHQSDLSLDQTTNKNIFRLSHSFEYREDLMTLWMTPPTPFDWSARNYLGQPGHGSFG